MFSIKMLLILFSGIIISFFVLCFILNESDTDLKCPKFRPGSFISIQNRTIFYRMLLPKKVVQNQTITDIILIHGFPTSLYDYDIVAQRLSNIFPEKRIIMHDMIGFGRSEKPKQNFDYSLKTQADFCLMLWRKLEVKSAHVIGHDMGDSVLTELIYRVENKLISSKFGKKFFKSIIFTNGGMRINKVSFRLGQILLLNPISGGLVNYLGNSISGFWRIIGSNQIDRLWSRPIENEQDKFSKSCFISQTIDLIGLNNGWEIMPQLIKYITDRYNMEAGWLDALNSSNIPCYFLWGDSDPVSPHNLFRDLHKTVPRCKTKLLDNVGHFPQLEHPDEWIKTVKSWIIRNES